MSCALDNGRRLGAAVGPSTLLGHTHPHGQGQRPLPCSGLRMKCRMHALSAHPAAHPGAQTRYTRHRQSVPLAAHNPRNKTHDHGAAPVPTPAGEHRNVERGSMADLWPTHPKPGPSTLWVVAGTHRSRSLSRSCFFETRHELRDSGRRERDRSRSKPRNKDAPGLWVPLTSPTPQEHHRPARGRPWVCRHEPRKGHKITGLEKVILAVRDTPFLS